MRRIKAKFTSETEETISELAKADFICTMADIWSSKHHSYLGISAHWLDDKMLRRSRVLACAYLENPTRTTELQTRLV